MSTKNLARTAIEGGRHKNNKWDRRNSHAEARAELRDYLKKVQLDEDFYYEADAEPTTHVGKGFDDKLGPMYRWLGRQVGRLWDEVRADIASSFDIRTTAGRHIIFDHLLRSVQTSPETHDRYYRGPEDPTTSYYKNDFYVDDDGVLREKRVIRHPGHYEKVPAIDTKQMCNWLNGRIVGKVGTKFFWFEPTAKNEKRGGYRHIWKVEYGKSSYWDMSSDIKFLYESYEVIYKKDSLGRVVIEDGRMVELERKPVWKKAYDTPSLRQDRKLNDKELAYWNSLPKYYRTKILECSPNYIEPVKKK